MENIAISISILALTVSVVSVLFAFKQTKANERQAISAEIDAMLPVTLDLLKEFRSEEFIKRRGYIKYKLRNEFPPTSNGYSDLTEDALINVTVVSHFLDNLGLFVSEGLIKEQFISKFIGGEIELLWRILEPYIISERQKTNSSPHYQKNFQALYELCNSHTQHNEFKNL